MSHFTRLKTKIANAEMLAAALADCGFSTVEVHDEAQHLYGYRGDRRKQTAEVIIRRKHVGRSSNDIGFKKGTDGTFDAVISRYDRGKYNVKWLDRLTQRYAYRAARKKLEEKGFDLVSEETKTDGQIHLVLRRMA